MPDSALEAMARVVLTFAVGPSPVAGDKCKTPGPDAPGSEPRWPGHAARSIEAGAEK